MKAYQDQFNNERYSSFIKTQRVISYILWFFHNIESKDNKYSGLLSPGELNNSTGLLLKMCESSVSPREMNSLRNKSLPQSRKILFLNSFLDTDGLLWVGGRFKYSSEKFNKKYPIWLPSKHLLTEKNVNYEHLRKFHAGPLATLSAIRNKYWLIYGRSTVKILFENL